MRHPVQRLFICSKTNRLFAGIAGHIQVFDINSGDLLSQWEAPPAGPPPASIKKKHKQSQMLTSISRTEKPPTKIPNQGSEGAQAGVDGAVVEAEEGTPVKKRKVGEITASPNANLAKPVTSENLPAPAEPSHKRKKVGPRAGLGWEGIRGVNSVTSIVGTASGRYLVVATNEDKTVRVFDVVRGTGEKGKLELLNERYV